CIKLVLSHSDNLEDYNSIKAKSFDHRRQFSSR
ncbi:hypothetical protein TNCT_58441, partial [Trichonephila clavata]